MKNTRKSQDIFVDSAILNEIRMLKEIYFIFKKWEETGAGIRLGTEKRLRDFFDSILMLALYKELRKRGSEVRAIGQLMYEIREEQALAQSRLARFILSKMLFSNYIKKKYQKDIAIMKENAYPENWEMEFVEGDGIEFDWGVDFHDCAVRKLYTKHGAEDLLPYVCMTDYAPFTTMKNVQFTRTQTLSSGGHYCDFRFKKGGSTPRAWPPEGKSDFKIIEKEK